MAQLMQGLDAVETAMFEVCNSDVVVLRDASRHILAAGGKRIRPRLALLSYAAAGGHDMREVARIAAAVELMHTASIVHDDINDHGVLRRGRPSVNAIWGRTFALLTGDFLFTKVYELMSPYKDLNIILADAAIALVEGETLQAAAVKENRFTREVYYDIIGRKTAALFRAAGLLGAHRAGATREQIDALGNFAFSIGLAFQIIDDILDITADSEKLGKTANIDLAQGKGYAAVNGGSSNGGGVAVAEQPADPMEKIKEKMLNGNYVEEGQQKAGELVQIAIAQLTVLPDSPAKSELIALANTTIEREY
jgi:geranylgeranyl pyrophosphate synthase